VRCPNPKLCVHIKIKIKEYQNEPTPPCVFGALPLRIMLKILGSAKEGLTGNEAKIRLASFGANRLKPPKRSNVLTLLVSQIQKSDYTNPFLRDRIVIFSARSVDAFIILSIVLISGLLGFWQERGASNAVEKLLFHRTDQSGGAP